MVFWNIACVKGLQAEDAFLQCSVWWSASGVITPFPGDWTERPFKWVLMAMAVAPIRTQEGTERLQKRGAIRRRP